MEREFEICVYNRLTGKRVIPHVVKDFGDGADYLELARHTAENCVAREFIDYRDIDEVVIEVWAPNGQTKVAARGYVFGHRISW